MHIYYIDINILYIAYLYRILQGYLLTRVEYKKHKHTTQHCFHDEVEYQRSRRDSAGIRLKIAIRVFSISSRINKRH